MLAGPALWGTQNLPDAVFFNFFLGGKRGPFWNTCTRAHCNLVTPLACFHLHQGTFHHDANKIYIVIMSISHTTTKMAECMIINAMPHNSPEILFFRCQRSQYTSIWVIHIWGNKQRCGKSKYKCHLCKDTDSNSINGVNTVNSKNVHNIKMITRTKCHHLTQMTLSSSSSSVSSASSAEIGTHLRFILFPDKWSIKCCIIIIIIKISQFPSPHCSRSRHHTLCLMSHTLGMKYQGLKKL